MVSLTHVAICQENVSVQQERMPQAFEEADLCHRAVTPGEEQQMYGFHQLTLWTPGKTSKNPGLLESIRAD